MLSPLAQFLRAHQDALVARWARKVSTRLGLEGTSRPQLVNHLPAFLDELACCLEMPPETWPGSDGAEAHGAQRIELGIDIGALAEEFGMVAEATFELAAEEALAIPPSDASTLLRLVARGTASSVRAYARLRDRQLAEEASRHFSFVAHELRTPLNSARIALELLKSAPETTEDQLERLERAHDQVARLIDDALTEARLEGELVLRPQTVSMQELLQEAAGNAAIGAERKDITIDVQVDDIELSLDRKLMVSALTNLLVNAVKFSRDGSTVRARGRSCEDRVLFEVSDHCGGLPEETRTQLFQPFAQTGRDQSGFGLGLMIVKQAVEAHKGVVRVANDPGVGCTFVIELHKKS